MHGSLSHTAGVQTGGESRCQVTSVPRRGACLDEAARQDSSGLPGIFDARWLASMGAVQNLSETPPVPARLIESAMGLARAEISLVLVRAPELAVRGVTARLATIVAAAFAQTLPLLFTLSPFLAKVAPSEDLVIGAVLSLAVAATAAALALLSASENASAPRSSRVARSSASSATGSSSSRPPDQPSPHQPYPSSRTRKVDGKLLPSRKE